MYRACQPAACVPVSARTARLLSKPNLLHLAALPPHDLGLPLCACHAGLGAVGLAAHTVVKQIIDFAMQIFGTFSTVAQTLVAAELGRVRPA